MPSITVEEIKKDIASKALKPIYFLYGNEDFYIDELESLFENEVIDASLRDFNQHLLYGNEVQTDDVINAVRSFPMMSNKQLIMVKEAQQLKQVDKLLSLLESPTPHSILVLSYRKPKIDGRTNFFKRLKKDAVILESKKMYDNKVPAWIASYAKSKGIKINPAASMLLLEYLGNDLTQIAHAIDRMLISNGGGAITKDHVADHIGINKQFSIFELQEALGNKQLNEVSKIGYFMALDIKNNPLQMVLPSLYGYVTKLLLLQGVGLNQIEVAKNRLGINAPFILKKYLQAARKYSALELHQIIAVLHEYDLKSKGVGNNSKDFTPAYLMEELFTKIIYIAQSNSNAPVINR